MRYTTPVIRSFFVFACILPVLTGAPDQAWPRQYTDGNAKLVLYQPQVDSWSDFKRLDARFAVSLATSKHAPPVWGVLSIEFGTTVDRKSRSVTFTSFSVKDMRYPSATDEAENKVWQALTIKLLPAQASTIALDRILAYIDESHWYARETEILFDPPPILVSKQAAVLVIIDGEPVPLDIGATSLQKIVNTNWDLFFDKKGERYYLRDDNVWLTAKALADGWTPVTQLPADFSRLPANDLYRDVLQAAAKPQKPLTTKLVLVVDKPSELIVLAGNPVLEPIPGTRLSWVANTGSDLFFDTAARQFYFLTSGRWFCAFDLRSNAWTAALSPLPDDFSKIPADHARAHVLASVPGTRRAREAVLNATIPQISTVTRSAIKAEVKYAGEPKFEPIAETGVSYAVNTPKDVLRADGRYYLCLDGGWLVSQSAAGPWQAADHIPEEIYAIPPSSPKHHLTYVTVAGADSESVTYRYSAGYNGAYIANGVLVWGTGYFYPPFFAPGPPLAIYWPSAYYTYGASTWYSPAMRGYVRGSSTSGPYGGYARAAAYDPATGAYSWGRPAWGAYGPRFRLSSGRVVQAHTAKKTPPGDFYAGKDGNVYRRDSTGVWTQNNGNSWVSLNGGDSIREALNYDSSARYWGNYNAQRSDSADKLGGWSSDGFVGRGISGWMMRSPGFGSKEK